MVHLVEIEDELVEIHDGEEHPVFHNYDVLEKIILSRVSNEVEQKQTRGVAALEIAKMFMISTSWRKVIASLETNVWERLTSLVWQEENGSLEKFKSSHQIYRSFGSLTLEGRYEEISTFIRFESDTSIFLLDDRVDVTILWIGTIDGLVYPVYLRGRSELLRTYHFGYSLPDDRIVGMINFPNHLVIGVLDGNFFRVEKDTGVVSQLIKQKEYRFKLMAMAGNEETIAGYTVQLKGERQSLFRIWSLQKKDQVTIIPTRFGRGKVHDHVISKVHMAIIGDFLVCCSDTEIIRFRMTNEPPTEMHTIQLIEPRLETFHVHGTKFLLVDSLGTTIRNLEDLETVCHFEATGVAASFNDFCVFLLDGDSGRLSSWDSAKGGKLEDVVFKEAYDNILSNNQFVVLVSTKSCTIHLSQHPIPAQTYARDQTSNPAPVAPSQAPAPMIIDVSASSSDTTTTEVPADAYGQVASNLDAKWIIEQLMELGAGQWLKDTVTRALHVAHNNPEGVVNYLYLGIPASIEVAVGGDGSLDFLRNNQQFQILRPMVKAYPQILQPILQELSKQNPRLLRLFQEHHAEFLRLINEPLEGAKRDLFKQPEQDMPHAISETPAEQEAIERLEAMGFDRALVIKAFFACDCNKELAAKYLLEHAGSQEVVAEAVPPASEAVRL